VTDEVLAEVVAWQNRPLEPMYPVIFFDALRVKIRDDAVVRNKAVYLALGVLPDGSRDVLGLWIEQTEGAKFWLKVFNELKTCGCRRRQLDLRHRQLRLGLEDARGRASTPRPRWMGFISSAPQYLPSRWTLPSACAGTSLWLRSSGPFVR